MPNESAGKSQAKPIPEGFHTLTPYLVCAGAAEAIAFYIKAFGALEVERLTEPHGSRILHAELRIGDSHLFVADEFPEMGCTGPAALGGSAVTLHMYCADTDALMARAQAAGATVSMPAHDAFWGDRYGRLTDPFGHKWSIATRLKQLAPDELQAAAVAAWKAREGGAA